MPEDITKSVFFIPKLFLLNCSLHIPSLFILNEGISRFVFLSIVTGATTLTLEDKLFLRFFISF